MNFTHEIRRMPRSVPLACLSALLALSGAAHAQSAGGQSNTLEEVVVTAQKRTENLQTVPLSVSAVGGAQIQSLHVQDLKDLTGTIPNVQIQVNAGLTNAASFVVRGIGIVANPSPYVGTEVGTVIDGVPQSVNELGLVDRFDVERIEVLRGPQGTLFGANTTGGVVNIVTRQPTGQFEVTGQVGVGNYQSRNASVSVNFPITDALSGKVLVANRSREGFYTNLYNGEDIGHINSTTARAYLRFKPSETFDATLKVEGNQARNGTDVLLNISVPGEIFYRPDTPFDFKLYSDVPDKHDADSYAVTLTTNWSSPFGQLTAIANYSDWKTLGYQDIDGIDLYGYAQVGNTRGTQGSIEVRDVFHPTDKLEVMVGLFHQNWTYISDGLGWLAFVSPQLQDDTLANQHTKNDAAFTQIYWDATDKLRLQIGARVSHEQVDMRRSDIFSLQPNGTNPARGYGNLNGAIILPTDPLNPEAFGDASWTNFGGKVGLDYKISDGTMAYGYYARGFKSGGFNGRISLAKDIGPFDPEFVDSFEVGLKSDFFDKRLRLNVAAFLNKWKDMQVNQVFFDGNPPTAHSAIINAAKATTKGLEVEAQMALGESLRLNATLGYLKANYDSFRIGSGAVCPPPSQPQPTPCTNVYDDRELPYSPKFNGSLTALYTVPIGTGALNATLQYTSNGERWGNYTQAASERIAKTDLVNASVEYSVKDDKWTVALWSRNLLNKKYVSLALDAPPLFTEGLLGNPREMGMDVRFKF